jgi:3-oxoadipate enol-lactonase
VSPRPAARRAPRRASAVRRRPAPYRDAPVPPVPLPPGRTVVVPDRGEFFVRDTGGDGPAVLLVHGWMFPSDLNWARTYAPLQRAGYRVLAMDLRGHGRGLRASDPFRLADCADDAAALLRRLGLSGATVVGYSMGGPVTQLLARRHPDVVAGFVLCATALDWSDPRMKAFWRAMGGLRLVLGAFPQGAWKAGMRLAGAPSRGSSWVAGELSRSSARDVAEAGRELGRFDSSGWAAELHPPAAVVVTTRDRLVPPRKQRALAEALGVEPHVVDGDHDACSVEPRRFTGVLLEALADLPSRQRRPA